MNLQLNDAELLQSHAFINGQWCQADSGETFSVDNPATGDIIIDVAKCAADETARAIAAAYSAQKTWARLPAKERAGHLRNWFDLMIIHQEDLAAILTAEQGKPLAEALGEIAYGASYVEWFAEEAKRIYGDVIPSPSGDKRLLVIRYVF